MTETLAAGPAQEPQPRGRLVIAVAAAAAMLLVGLVPVCAVSGQVDDDPRKASNTGPGASVGSPPPAYEYRAPSGGNSGARHYSHQSHASHSSHRSHVSSGR